MVQQQQDLQRDIIQHQDFVHQQASGQQPHSVQGRDFQQSYISYRQQRRISQGQRQNGRNTRGQTRGVKWRNERNNRLGIKPSCSITSDMKRIVGENANQFITEAGSLVRSMLTLKCRGWKDMGYDIKQRLLNKIKADWNFPEGENVDQIVEKQCQALYRHWRYKLKENYFNGLTLADAAKNCPQDVHPDQWKWIIEKYWGSEKVKRISDVNRANRSKQKVKGIQGSKSTARILNMMRKYEAGNSSQSSEQVTHNSEEGTQASQDTVIGSNEVPSEPPLEPEYIRLWTLTKRHKDNSWDMAAEQKLEDFKALHRQQVELYGVDNLTVQEAYMEVLGTSSGYINGLGFGPKPPKRIVEGRSGGEGIEIAHQMAEQLEQMERHSREREAKLKVQLEKDSREREAELKGEIQRLREDKNEML